MTYGNTECTLYQNNNKMATSVPPDFQGEVCGYAWCAQVIEYFTRYYLYSYLSYVIVNIILWCSMRWIHSSMLTLWCLLIVIDFERAESWWSGRSYGSSYLFICKLLTCVINRFKKSVWIKKIGEPIWTYLWKSYSCRVFSWLYLKFLHYEEYVVLSWIWEVSHETLISVCLCTAPLLVAAYGDLFAPVLITRYSCQSWDVCIDSLIVSCYLLNFSDLHYQWRKSTWQKWGEGGYRALPDENEGLYPGSLSNHALEIRDWG